ncbi:MAG: MBL fold metallo-hydrolase [Planctomycetota bacterium]|nr:MBL fold metallo-hydrolase [Planctomycetota bacterium]
MRWLVLNPPSSTAFLLPDGAGPGRDVLVDMQGARPTLAETLSARGRSTETLAHLFLTHHHGDHFVPAEALALARAGTRIHAGRATWEEFRALAARTPQLADAREACGELEASGALDLLPARGEAAFESCRAAWSTFPHGDGDASHVNLAFRFGETLISGDTNVPAFLDPRNPDAAALLGLERGEPVRALMLNVAQLSRAELRARQDLPPRRLRNYLRNHGILDDLLAALEDERLAGFFSGLRLLVPHHLRREPLDETADRMRQALREAARRRGFEFEIRFGAAGLDAAERTGGA